MDSQHNVFTCPLMIIFVLIQFGDVWLCSTDCTAQAGVPCKVVSSSVECPKPKTDEGPDYPEQPGSIHILPVPNGEESVGINVTWPYEYNGFIKGFQLVYDVYFDFKDATKSTLDTCTLFNFTSHQVPSGQVTFSHNCIAKPTRMIYLAALPQINTSAYIHRVTAGFKQDHGDSSGLWQPELIVIHNDSCNSIIEVELFLAPKEFNFVEYRIGFASIDRDEDYKDDHKDINVDPNLKHTSVTFKDVPYGTYTIVVIPEPNDEGTKCICNSPKCSGARGCVYSETGAFLLQKDHPKCKENTIPSTTVHVPTTDDNFIIVITTLVSLLVIGTLILAIIVVVLKFDGVIRRKLKALLYKHSPSDGDDLSVISPDPTEDFASGTSPSVCQPSEINSIGISNFSHDVIEHNRLYSNSSQTDVEMNAAISEEQLISPDSGIGNSGIEDIQSKMPDHVIDYHQLSLDYDPVDPSGKSVYSMYSGNA